MSEETKKVLIHFGCGYGQYSDEIEVPVSATLEEIEDEVQQYCQERLWWSWGEVWTA